MAEVNVQGKACEFEVNDSVARAFVKLAKAYFALPGVQEDYKRWEAEYDKRMAEKAAAERSI